VAVQKKDKEEASERGKARVETCSGRVGKNSNKERKEEKGKEKGRREGRGRTKKPLHPYTLPPTLSPTQFQPYLTHILRLPHTTLLPEPPKPTQPDSWHP
jgi:hypothetical protein